MRVSAYALPILLLLALVVVVVADGTRGEVPYRSRASCSLAASAGRLRAGALDDGRGSPYSAQIQYMITRKMRKVLVDDLNYLPEEVDDMEPQIAAVVIEKSLPRPRAGMPMAWRRSIRSSPPRFRFVTRALHGARHALAAAASLPIYVVQRVKTIVPVAALAWGAYAISQGIGPRIVLPAPIDVNPSSARKAEEGSEHGLDQVVSSGAQGKTAIRGRDTRKTSWRDGGDDLIEQLPETPEDVEELKREWERANSQKSQESWVDRQVVILVNRFQSWRDGGRQ